MRMIDENGVEITTHDPDRGYLTQRRILAKHHAAIEAVAEQGHYETVREYPNGGKDVEWVVDVPGVEAKDAWDEYEDVQQFVPFTAAELSARRIAELKQQLLNTDYHILKIVEGAATLKECAEVIAKRAAWRREINELEKED